MQWQILFALVLMLGFSATAEEPALIPSPAAKFEDVKGDVIFEGVYEHRSRGKAGYLHQRVKVKRADDGSLAAYGEYVKEDGAAADEMTFARGAKDGRVTEYISYHPESQIRFVIGDGEIIASDAYRKTFGAKWEIPGEGTRFDPNSRPDMYATAPLLLAGHALKEGETKRVPVYDIVVQTGDRMVDYELELTHKGKATVEVPAGTFEANHIVQTQTKSAPTWYQKKEGHVTEYWVLDNGVIVRILRHREPYELLLESIVAGTE